MSSPHGIISESQKSLKKPEFKFDVQQHNRRTSIVLKKEQEKKIIIVKKESPKNIDSHFIKGLSKFRDLQFSTENTFQTANKTVRNHKRDLPSLKAKIRNKKLAQNGSRRFLKICSSSRNTELFTKLREKIIKESKKRAQNHKLRQNQPKGKNVPVIINLEQESLNTERITASQSGVMKVSALSTNRSLKPEIIDMKADKRRRSNALPDRFTKNPRKSLRLKFLGGNQKMIQSKRASKSQHAGASSRTMKRFGDLPLFPQQPTAAQYKAHPFMMSRTRKAMLPSRKNRTKGSINRENIRNSLKIFNMRDIPNTRQSDASRTLSQCNKFFTADREATLEGFEEAAFRNQFNQGADLGSFEISKENDVYLQQSFGFQL
ncbi:unnamed protein product [Moneuplotes crassus]|uniref:Uncharacterized protein n=1 Tax=Euplotes crassus TaxID=5936 RepID=A0AAD1UL55_EUPCR|nr:unnamed protein product [Moneuplotes crassus]